MHHHALILGVGGNTPTFGRCPQGRDNVWACASDFVRVRSGAIYCLLKKTHIGSKLPSLAGWCLLYDYSILWPEHVGLFRTQDLAVVTLLVVVWHQKPSFNLPSKMSTNLLLKFVCKAMERVAPLRLAEKWDNVRSACIYEYLSSN